MVQKNTFSKLLLSIKFGTNFSQIRHALLELDYCGNRQQRLMFLLSQRKTYFPS